MLPANDPGLKSWVDVSDDSDFPIQNLPFGVFRQRNSGEAAVGVAIGEMVLDLTWVHRSGLFGRTAIAGENLFARPALNDFMARGRPVWTEVRNRVSELLGESNTEIRDNEALRSQALVRRTDVEMLLPAQIHNYTDFYSCKEHASNVGAMFRDPENRLLPNWVHIPVGYHGRASSIVVSGVDIHRPMGQTKPDDAESPVFGPSRLLDFELEVGFFTGPGNELGSRISTAEARDHIFGLVLVNDWSARDIQKWEYVPLGPFLSKSFATSVSPWVVTLDALEPFRVAGPRQDPPVLPYLQFEGDWAYDLNLEVWLAGEGIPDAVRLMQADFRRVYWNILQQLAHQTVNGCNVLPGDLYASGTVSGPTYESGGSLLELCWKGTRPLKLPGGGQRTFLKDGDTVMMRGYGQGRGYRVGFGELRGTVLPAIE